MSEMEQALATLIAKDEIRELAMLYSRGVDRKDAALLRTLYTRDGTDDHAQFFKGTAEAYCDFLERSMPHMRYSGHHICNHLIAVDGDTAEGEVYAVAWHVLPDGQGGFIEDIQNVRYIDRYAKEDGRWRFAARTLECDNRTQRPITTPPPERDPLADASVTGLTNRLFARG
jgi:hypothetical protein